MGIFQIDSLTDSGDNRIDLYPEPSFEAREQAIRASHRTLGGVHRVYDWNNFKAFTVPWRFVNSADTFRVNQWWRDSDILGFTLNSSEDLKTVDCRLTNDAQPLGGMISPYNDLHEDNHIRLLRSLVKSFDVTKPILFYIILLYS